MSETAPRVHWDEECIAEHDKEHLSRTKKTGEKCDRRVMVSYSSETKKRHMGVSKNNGTPKSSILIGFSIINHPFLWYPKMDGL